MRVGLLGLQGAFLDHLPHLSRCGVDTTIVRTAEALGSIDRLIIPGGESTVMAKFLDEFAMTSPLTRRILSGMPVWGICAGSILLADTVDGRPGYLRVLPVDVTRNAYGRQIASLELSINVPVLEATGYNAVFIRSPRIERVDEAVQVYAYRDTDPVFVRHNNIMATTFHPELNDDNLFHHYFLSL